MDYEITYNRDYLLNSGITSNNSNNTNKVAPVTAGISGLTNIGNTCYMNSAIQCLAATDLLVYYINKKKFKDDLYNNIIGKLTKNKINSNTNMDLVNVNMYQVNDIIKKSVVYNTYKLFTNIWSVTREIEPRSFKDSVGLKNSLFKGFNQNDSQEFLSFVLDQIHEETKSEQADLSYNNLPENVKTYIVEYNILYNQISNMGNLDNNLDNNLELLITKQKQLKYNYYKEYLMYKSLRYWYGYLTKNSSIITDLFTGLFYTEITCLSCKKNNHVFEPFNILSVPLTGLSLDKCLTSFSEPEKLEGQNQYKCDSCKQMSDATKTTYIWFSPTILVIQLKRFNGVMHKNNKLVTFPITNLSLNTSYSPHNETNKSDSYDLYAVINHYGSLGGGHYTAHTKNPVNNNWYHYNDSSVSFVQDPETNLVNEVVTPSSYILFYKLNR